MKKLFVVLLIISSSFMMFAQKKIVLLETFTSTTCPPCVPANSYMDNWLTNSTNKSQTAIIKYHVWWPAPGNDPFYLENTADVQNRRTYYGVGAVPYGFVDGMNYASNYPTWTTAIQSKAANAANVNLSIAKGANINEAKINIENVGNYAMQNYTLQVVLVESKLYYTGTNGDPVHNYVMRKMYPDFNGETFSLAVNAKQSFTRTFQPNSSWNKSNMAVVAFVQYNPTKEILQAVMIDYSVLTSVENENSIPNEFSLEQNYPNPFNPSTAIRYKAQAASHVTLKVYDALGNEVATLVDELKQPGTYNSQFSIFNYELPSGIYFYRLTAGNFSETKKMILMK